MLNKLKELWQQESKEKESDSQKYLNSAVDIPDLEYRMKNMEYNHSEKFFAFYDKNQNY